MSSWRDVTSEQTQNDADQLLNESLELAIEQLETHGEFHPFAFKLTTAGELVLAAVDADEDRPDPGFVISTLIADTAAERHQLRAAAIVAAVYAQELKTDAVRVMFEHSEGLALFSLLPYSKRKFKRGILYGDLQAGQGSPNIWP